MELLFWLTLGGGVVLRTMAFAVPLLYVLILAWLPNVEEEVSLVLKVEFLFHNLNLPSSMSQLSSLRAMVKAS